MKKLIFILILLAIVPHLAFSQSATNNVINTATIYSTNSPVKFNAYVIITNGTSSVLTNNATVYQQAGIIGFSGSVTNVGVGNTNVCAYGSGVLTNRFFIP